MLDRILDHGCQHKGAFKLALDDMNGTIEYLSHKFYGQWIVFTIKLLWLSIKNDCIATVITVVMVPTVVPVSNSVLPFHRVDYKTDHFVWN